MVGAVGHFLAAPIAIFYGIILGGLFLGGFVFAYNRLDLIVLTTILFAAIVVHLFGAFGFWRNYGPGIGLGAFVYGIVAGVLPPAGTILLYLGGPTTQGTLGGLLFFVGILAVGVLFILEGVAFIVSRHFTAMRGLSVAVGILFIVAGSLMETFFLAFVGFFLLIPAFILGGIVMVRAHVPMLSALGVPPPAEAPPPMAPPTPNPAPPPTCPRCGRPLTFVAATQRWYCSAEGFYP